MYLHTIPLHRLVIILIYWKFLLYIGVVVGEHLAVVQCSTHLLLRDFPGLIFCRNNKCCNVLNIIILEISCLATVAHSVIAYSYFCLMCCISYYSVISYMAGKKK